MEFAKFLNETAPEDATPSRSRVRIPEDELSRRLEFYAKYTEGFEATDEHLQALINIFNEHRNVFLTGGAGTGKTTFVKHVVIRELDYRNLRWAVTATTGIAGSHLNGKTLHSFFGIGLGPDWPPYYPSKVMEFLPWATPGAPVPSPQDMADEELEGWYQFFFDRWINDSSIRAATRQGVIQRLSGHEVLIIDEISMCAGDGMLGYLEFMLRQLRKDERPFGGLQVLAVGDFCQLPPVEKRNDVSRPDWAFLSRAWERAKVEPVELTKTFRQGDVEFVEFLNSVRLGRLTQRDKAYASRFVRNDLTREEMRFYPFLMTHNEQVRQINAQALQDYPPPTFTLEAEFLVAPGAQSMREWEVNNESRVRADLTKSLGLLEPQTFVRVGMPVMFTVNDPEGNFVNGTWGFVREVNLKERSAPRYDDEDTLVVAVPTEGGGERLISVGRWPFSRAREQDPRAALTLPHGYNEERGTQLPSCISLYPTVRQFPVMPAVAITIHKSQGASLDSAIIALAKSFSPGHAYVGLSRLRSPSGLILTDADFEVQTDPWVMDYYRSIKPVE